MVQLKRFRGLGRGLVLDINISRLLSLLARDWPLRYNRSSFALASLLPILPNIQNFFRLPAKHMYERSIRYSVMANSGSSDMRPIASALHDLKCVVEQVSIASILS